MTAILAGNEEREVEVLNPLEVNCFLVAYFVYFFFLVSKVAFWNSNRFDEIINQKRLLLTKISGLSTT